MWKTFLLSGSLFIATVMAALAAPRWLSPSFASTLVALLLCAVGVVLIFAPKRSAPLPGTSAAAPLVPPSAELASSAS